MMWPLSRTIRMLKNSGVLVDWFKTSIGSKAQGSSPSLMFPRFRWWIQSPEEWRQGDWAISHQMGVFWSPRLLSAWSGMLACCFPLGPRERCRQTAGEAGRAVNNRSYIKKVQLRLGGLNPATPLGMFLNWLFAVSQSATGVAWLAVHTSGSVLELESFLDITRWRFTKSHCGTWDTLGSTQEDFRWGHINIRCTFTLNGFSKFYQSFWFRERESISLGLVDFYAH